MCRVDDAEPCSVYDAHVVKAARKAHRCSECGRTIERGESYLYWFGVYDGMADYGHVCQHCQIGREWLDKNCGGHVFGQVTEEVHEHAQEYRALALPLLRYTVAARRKWKRFGSDALMPIPAVMPSIKSVIEGAAA
jgi:hypothetical protein